MDHCDAQNARILRTATALFYRQGYSPVTMGIVANHAESGIIDLYSSYSSKADLFGACLEDMITADSAVYSQSTRNPAVTFLRRVADNELRTALPPMNRPIAREVIEDILQHTTVD